MIKRQFAAFGNDNLHLGLVAGAEVVYAKKFVKQERVGHNNNLRNQ